MKVLVTGGAGYVGSHVVRALVEAGHEPVIYDNLSTGHAAAVKGLNLRVGDVGDKDRLVSLLKEECVDGIVHLAAFSLVGESVQNPAKYFRNNLINGVTLLDALVEADVPWIVLSSTAAVYGNPEELPISERHRESPTNPYGESKLALERTLKWYRQAYGLESVALRYFNAAGAHVNGDIGEDHSPESHLIPLVLQAALGRRTLEVYGADYATPDGTAVRDYVHVSDLANAHVLAIARLKDGGESTAFNLGNQRGYSVLEVMEVCSKVTGKQIPFELAPRRPGDPPVLVADATKAQRELRWVPQRDLAQIVASAWDWHLTHPDGFRTVQTVHTGRGVHEH